MHKLERCPIPKLRFPDAEWVKPQYKARVRHLAGAKYLRHGTVRGFSSRVLLPIGPCPDNDPAASPGRGQSSKTPGGYKVRDAHGQSLAYVYGRETRADADIAHVLTMHEVRRIASNIAKLPTLL